MAVWELTASEVILDTPWLRIKKNSYLLPTGTELSDYYVVERASFVLVLARQRDSLVLVRQYRPATRRHYHSLPAGYINEGEAVEAAAARELEEETGLTGSRFEIIGKLDPLPGYISSEAYVVVCAVSDDQSLAIRDHDEIENVASVPVTEVLNLIKRGEVNEMQAVSAVLLAQLTGSF